MYYVHTHARYDLQPTQHNEEKHVEAARNQHNSKEELSLFCRCYVEGIWQGIWRVSWGVC